MKIKTKIILASIWLVLLLIGSAIVSTCYVANDIAKENFINMCMHDNYITYMVEDELGSEIVISTIGYFPKNNVIVYSCKTKEDEEYSFTFSIKKERFLTYCLELIK